jgi:hypothetical protein
MSTFDDIAKKIARKYKTDFNPGKDVEVRPPGKAIEVETDMNTIDHGIQQLQDYKDPRCLAVPKRIAPEVLDRVDVYIDTCEGWITMTADHFSAFIGSMHLERFDKEWVRNFLRQFETKREVELIQGCLDQIAKNFWTVSRFEKTFLRDLRKKIKSLTMPHQVVYVPFGHPLDSSALVLASSLKGLDIEVENLVPFLLYSTKGMPDHTPKNTVICFIDDNIATGTQAPAIFKQYFGKETPEEEFHVRPLDERLREELKKYRIYLCLVYASEEGVKSLKESTEELGLAVDVLPPIVPFECTTYANAFPDPKEQAELKALFIKYGVPLLSDKFGPRWNDEFRRKEALGYGGLGQLFLFWYQTPTSMPILFWRYGEVRSQLWQPLFWRESDFERFMKRCELTAEHKRNPHGVWEQYQAFNIARRKWKVNASLNEFNDFYKYAQPELQRNKRELFAMGRRADNVYFWDILICQYFNLSAVPAREEFRIPSSIPLPEQPQPPTDQELLNALGWRRSIGEKRKRNLKILKSLFNPQHPAALSIPLSDALSFAGHLGDIKQDLPDTWTASLLINLYKQCKESKGGR